MRSIILVASVIAVALFVVAFIAYPHILNTLLRFLASFVEHSEINAVSPTQFVHIHALTATSLALLPIFAMLTTWGTRKIKGQPADMGRFRTHLLILTTCYVVAVGAKFLIILYAFKNLDSMRVHPSIINSISLASVSFYQEGFWMAGLTAVMAVLLTKKANTKSPHAGPH